VSGHAAAAAAAATAQSRDLDRVLVAVYVIVGRAEPVGGQNAVKLSTGGVVGQVPVTDGGRQQTVRPLSDSDVIALSSRQPSVTR